MRTHAEFNQRMSEFVSTGTVACPDCGELLPAGDDEARQAHYALCKSNIALTDSEEKRLAALEVTIESGLKVFFEVGTALLEIRDSRLYRRDYKKFEDYCRVRWQLKQSRAYQLMDAASVVGNLESSTNGGTLPDNERQTRPLTQLAPEEQVLVWQVVTDTAPAGKVTEAHVRSVVNVMKEVTATGAIDNGEGEQIPVSQATTAHVKAAITEETYERLKRQETYVSEKLARKEKRRADKAARPIPESSSQTPRYEVAQAEALPLEDNCVDLIITSPPYNMGNGSWNMGGEGRTKRATGIGYEDAMPEADYQAWQVDCLVEMYRVAKPGASLFYNHKERFRQGAVILPTDWLRHARNPWVLRQVIVWNRTSTHNHNEAYFYPEVEYIYWLTKGAPELPERSIGLSCLWTCHGMKPDTWHPAPFVEDLPEMLIKAIGRKPPLTVLDPFAGSGTTLKVASRYGYEAIGFDANPDYVKKALEVNRWNA